MTSDFLSDLPPNVLKELEAFRENSATCQTRFFLVGQDFELEELVEVISSLLGDLGALPFEKSVKEKMAGIKAKGRVLGQKKAKILCLVKIISPVVAVKFYHDLKTKSPTSVGSIVLQKLWKALAKKFGGAGQKAEAVPAAAAPLKPTTEPSLPVSPLVEALNEMVSSDSHLGEIVLAVEKDREVFEAQFRPAYQHLTSQEQYKSSLVSTVALRMGRQVPFENVLIAVERIDIGAIKLRPVQITFLAWFPYTLKLDLTVSDKGLFSLEQAVHEDFKIKNTLNLERPLLRRYLAEAYDKETFFHLVRDEYVEDRGKTAKFHHDVRMLDVIKIRTIVVGGTRRAYVAARFWTDEKGRNLPRPSLVIRAFLKLAEDLRFLADQPAGDAVKATAAAPAPASPPSTAPAQEVAKGPTKCPNCGWLVSAGKDTCPRCKKPLVAEAKRYVNEELRELRLVSAGEEKEVGESFDANLFHLEKLDKKLTRRVAAVSSNVDYVMEEFGSCLPRVRALGQWDVHPVRKYLMAMVGTRHFDKLLVLVDFIDRRLGQWRPLQLTFVVRSPKVLYYNFALNSRGEFVGDLDPRIDEQNLGMLLSRHGDVQDAWKALYARPASHALEAAGDVVEEEYPVRAVTYEADILNESVVVAKFFLGPDRSGFPHLAVLTNALDDLLEAFLERVPSEDALPRCASCNRVLVGPGPLCGPCGEKEEVVRAVTGTSPATGTVVGVDDPLADFLGGTSADSLDEFLGPAATQRPESAPQAAAPTTPEPPAQEDASPLSETEQRIQELKYQVSSIRDLIDTLRDAFANGTISFEDYQARSEEYQRAIQDLEAKISELRRSRR
ncbi:MAG: hypothetical protein Kow0069_21220 [Promethearchaeota archaeon]